MVGSDCLAPDERRRPRTLLLRRADLERLKAEVAAGGGRSPEEAEEQRAWAEHLGRLKEGTRRLAGDMGCVAQQEHDRLAAKGAAKEAAAKAERERAARLTAEDRSRRRSELLGRCREMLASQNNAGRRALDSALVFAETLREREAQLAFDECLRAAQQRYEHQWEERVRSDMARQEAVERAREELLGERRREYKEALLKQLEDNAAVREDEKRRLAEERRQLDAMKEEIDIAVAREKGATAQRKVAFRRAMLESLDDHQRAERQRYETALEEERVARVFRDMQAKINDACKRNQKERMQEIIHMRKKCGEKIWTAYENYVKSLEEEEEKRRKAQEEEERRWSEREKMEDDHRNCVIAYRQQGHQEYLKVEVQKKATAVSNAKYYADLRKRMDEENHKFEQQLKERLRRQQMQARENYSKGVAERKELEKQEEETEKKFLAIAQCLWKEDDDQFFKYANELIQEAQDKGRMLLPLERAIHEYKKKNYLLPRTKRTNTVKSPNKC